MTTWAWFAIANLALMAAHVVRWNNELIASSGIAAVLFWHLHEHERGKR